MELGLQEWSIIVGVVILAGISLDGLRRTIRAKRSEIRLSSKLGKGISDRDPLEEYSSELPSGGARVIGRESSIDTHSSAVGAYEDEVPTLSSKVNELETQTESVELTPGHNLDASGEVLTLFVKARDNEQFSGHQVVECLLNSGINYGAKKIFHAHEQNDLSKGVSFSVANMKEPGYFDLDAMASFHTPGLIFFMSAPKQNAKQALNDMICAAKACVEELGGELLDQQQSKFTNQTQNHYEERLHSIEREALAKSSEHG